METAETETYGNGFLVRSLCAVRFKKSNQVNVATEI